MQLLCTPNSLYSRIVRIAALELGVTLAVRFVGVRAEADVLLIDNPAGKVPTLVLGDGCVLTESRLICEHLQKLAGRAIMAPVDDLDGRALEGQVTGFADGIAVWVRELRRPASDRSASVIALESERARRCLDRFETLNWTNAPLSYAQISLWCTIELLTVNGLRDWANSRPNLRAWAKTLAARPELAASRPAGVR